MERFISVIFRGIFRLILMVAGLVFIASLMALGLLLLAVWLVRALFARLTGRPVTPWAFKINRQAQWSRFYPGSDRNTPSPEASDVIDAEVREVKETRTTQFLER